MLDCIEIDGASNNGVENVRDLIEKARFEPNQWTYKIYIIDEVHMLSTGAFNALLKTLEEPPKHVKFILATTEIEKVPETIRSRSFRFDFKKISETDIIKRLEYVYGQEHITAEKEALEIIARAARGALRDALTLTEQNTINGEIKTEYVRSTLSLIEDSLIDEIIQVIGASDADAMILILDTLRTRHAEVRGLFDQILYGLRDQMLATFRWNRAPNTPWFEMYSEIFAIFESAYSRIKIIPDGWLLIEITLMRAVARGEQNIIQDSELKIQKKDKELWKQEEISKMGVLGGDTTGVRWKKDEVTLSKESTEKDKIKETRQIPTEWQNEKETEKESKKEDPEINSGWQNKKETRKEEKLETSSSSFSYIHLLEEVKKVKSTLVLDLKTARFELSDTILILVFVKEWHYNRANTPSMKNIISESLTNLYTGNWSIECRLDVAGGASIADGVF